MLVGLKTSKREASLMLSATCKQFMEKLKEVSANKPCVKMSLGQRVSQEHIPKLKAYFPICLYCYTPNSPTHINKQPPGKG